MTAVVLLNYDESAAVVFNFLILLATATTLFMYLAFSMERVSIVAPLINSYVVFVLLLTPLMARRIEVVTARKVIGAALVVAGIFFVSAGRN